VRPTPGAAHARIPGRSGPRRTAATAPRMR